MPRKPIIGVIGGNKTDGGTQRAAELLGHWIAVRDAILLTGSQPEQGQQVKRVAMRGAVQAARTDGVFARLIGVLPKEEQIVFRVEQSHQLLIPTGLASGQRNPINSLTSDAVLVLNGGSGTLAELGFALVANKTCRLVGSAKKLRDTWKLDLTEVQNLIEQGLSAFRAANGQSLTAEHILERISKHLADGSHDLPLPDDADRAQAWVDTTLSKIDPHLLLHSSGFPGIPGVLSKSNFENWLSRMP